jgi:hypothetical protein
MDPRVKAQCLDVMDALSARPTAQMFLNPIDPVANCCPDYFDIISRPMDLGTIRSNLESGRYRSVAAWKADVDLVWANSIQYNSTGRTNSLLVLITRDLQKQFVDLSRPMAESYREIWKFQLVQMHAQLSDCIREVIKIRAKPQKRGAAKRDQLFPALKELPPAVMRRHFKFFTKEELVQLTNDMNSIKEEAQLAMISALVKKNEPELADDCELPEIDINMLRPATLTMIREQVDQILRS